MILATQYVLIGIHILAIVLPTWVLIAGFIEDKLEDWEFQRAKEAQSCPPISAPQSHFVSVPYSLLERRRLYSGMSEALET